MQKKFSLRSYLNAASDLYITSEMIADAYEYRKAMEIECGRLAMSAATEEDFKRIQNSIDVYLEIGNKEDLRTEEGLRSVVSADLDIHYQMCKATHNSLFELAFNATRAAVYNYLYIILNMRFGNGEKLYTSAGGLDGHQLVLNAIRDKDFEQFKQVYELLIDYRIDKEEHRKIFTTQNTDLANTLQIENE